MFLSPFIYFICGLCYGVKQTHNEFKRELFDKKYGWFTSDEIYEKQGDKWEKIQKLIRNKRRTKVLWELRR